MLCFVNMTMPQNVHLFTVNDFYLLITYTLHGWMHGT